MTDILKQMIKPADETVEASIGDETVLLQQVRGAYYGLDTMGTHVWLLLKQGREPVEICEAIAREFEVDLARVEDDVRRYLTDLKNHELVVER